MQQTQTYKLNLIETSDAFSPSPLNENMEKVEGALAALDGAAADLQSRVTVLEAKKMVVGTYTGRSTLAYAGQTIELGFAPIAVIACGRGSTTMALQENRTTNLELTETGFIAYNGGTDFNQNGYTYNYIALG